MDELLQEIYEILARVNRDDATQPELLAAVRETLEVIEEEEEFEEEEDEDDYEDEDEGELEEVL